MFDFYASMFYIMIMPVTRQMEVGATEEERRHKSNCMFAVVQGNHGCKSLSLSFWFDQRGLCISPQMRLRYVPMFAISQLLHCFSLSLISTDFLILSMPDSSLRFMFLSSSPASSPPESVAPPLYVPEGSGQGEGFSTVHSEPCKLPLQREGGSSVTFP